MILPFKDRFVTVLDKQLRIRCLNQTTDVNKPVLVFLHEGLGCIELWKDFPQRLAEATGLNAILYERQGYGKSESLDLPRSLNYLEIEAQEYLPALLKKLDIKKPILVGHSDGGTIALIYAALYSTQLVVAMAAHVLVERITIEGIQKAVQQYDKNTIGKKLEKYHGTKADDLFWAWANTWLNPDFRTWNIEHFLPQINCPTILIQGKEDEYATNHQLELIADRIGANATTVLLENCAHIPHIQAKEVLLDKVTSFIKKTRTITQERTTNL
ncbi:alpha/beta fold hydrolase [Aureispira anguillae]|uniref:Alpha/beta hydrolase n=1 Tax=Aureispira anguillae TaxID=2864201 RepID=A0A915YKJ5_9BACT|nr:alpha/beta hydrolase [Aureispira anguillae]BDS14908.1 alpha/beta hydrolase [Aureispira anguillae]